MDVGTHEMDKGNWFIPFVMVMNQTRGRRHKLMIGLYWKSQT